MLKNCKYCDKEFEGHFNARYCTMKCKDAYKVRKDTGERKECIVCNEIYIITYGRRRNKNQVCSVTCRNVLASKRGKYVSLAEIEEIISNTPYQMSAAMVADKLGTSTTMIHDRAISKYGTYKNMIISLLGRYVNTNDSRSQTANSLFYMVEDLYGVVGNFEQEFDDLVNPLTGNRLLVDYYLKDYKLAIEYHGRQHYEDIPFFRSGSTLKGRKTRDSIKKKYLEDNDITLVIFSCYHKLTEETVRKKLDKYLLNKGIPSGL